MKLPAFLDRWSRHREIVGMDLGAPGVKFLKLRLPANGRGDRFEVAGQFYFPGNLRAEAEGLLPSCREFLAANGLNGAAVACNIEHPSLKIRRIDLPKMPDFDLQEAVRWQLRDVAEGSIDSYVVRYSVLQEYLAGDVRRLSLVAFAVKREAVTEVQSLLKKLTLRPILIEPTAVSLLAAFDRVHGWKAGETYALVDLEESQSLFLVVGDEKLFFSRPMTFLPLQEGPSVGGAYTTLAIEIQKSLDAYSLLFRKERVDRLFVTGFAARSPELVEHLSKNLGVSAEIFDPLAGKGEEGCRFVVAFGLALYEH